MITPATPLAFCSDHAGFALKSVLMAYAQEQGMEVKDFGAYSPERCDYPDFAHPMASAIERGECLRGIAICGTGNGVLITLNKHQGIRAGLTWMEEIAQLIRQHNDANVCVLPGRFITTEEAKRVMDTFLQTPFEGGRHTLRLAKIPLSGCNTDIKL